MMNRAGDAEFLLQDVVYTGVPNEKNKLKDGFVFGFGMLMGLWLAAMIAGAITIGAMILLGISLQ